MNIIGKTALCAFLFGCAAAAHAQTSSPRTVRVGQSVSGELQERERESERDWIVDYYDLRGTRGETVTITLTSEDFDPYIDLDKGDEHLADDDDGGEILDAKLVYRFEENGTYRINVSSSERDETGRYTLKVERGGRVEENGDRDEDADARPANRTPRDAPNPQPIRYGQTIQGQLTETSPLHSDDTPYAPYRFQGRKGEVVTVELQAAQYDAYVILRRPGADEELTHDDDGAGGGTDARLIYTLPVDGEYEILANAVEEDAKGPFTLKLGEPRTAADLAREARAKAVQVGLGQVTRGKLESSDGRADDNTYYDLFRLTLKARQTVAIQLSSDDFDAYLKVRDGSDKELAVNDDSTKDSTDAEIVFTAPADGEYLIEANTANEGETGNYVLGVSTK